MKTPEEKAEALKRLMEKLPDLGRKNVRIMLQLSHFKKLTDLEFIILWHMPGLDIMVEPKTQKYVESRRQKLGVKFDDVSGYNLKGEEVN